MSISSVSCCKALLPSDSTFLPLVKGMMVWSTTSSTMSVGSSPNSPGTLRVEYREVERALVLKAGPVRSVLLLEDSDADGFIFPVSIPGGSSERSGNCVRVVTSSILDS